MRKALALYLVLVMLAGPWLCCCTTSRLSTLLTPEPTQPDSNAPTSCSCCHEDGSAQPEKDELPGPPAQDPPSCPCHHQHTVMPALLPAEARTAEALCLIASPQ